MTALVVALALFAWVWWLTRPSQPAPPPPAPVAPVPTTHPVLVLTPAAGWLPRRSHLPSARPSVRPDAPPWPLTEDDLIAFGIALEQSEDVLAELVRRS